MAMKQSRAVSMFLALRLAGLICCGTVVALSQTPQPTGLITGLILGPNQERLAGVIVLINSRPGPVNPPVPLNASVATRADGTFILTGVADGTYSVCPHPPKPNLLPPCSWSAEPRAVVANGQPGMVPAIQFQSGVDFYVRVNDPNGTRAAAEGKVPGAALFLAIRAPNGRMFPIPMTARDSGGADHHLLVPSGTNLSFTALSSAFSMTNAAGQAISNQTGLTVPVSATAVQSQVQQVINIR